MEKSQQDPLKEIIDLNDLILAQKYPELVALTDTIIKKDPKNEIAQKVKIAALIHNDQYKEALQVIKGQAEYSIETAYCHFQLNDFTKTLEALSKMAAEDLPSLYLHAQIHYRKGEYDKCIEAYEKIIKSSKEKLVDEQFINLSAAFIQNRNYKALLDKSLFEKLKNSYDGMLHLSIALTEEGRIDEAYSFLKNALRMRLTEDSQIEPYNDFQLHHLYILQSFVPYDTSPEARELIHQYKTLANNTKDEQAKLVLLDNKVALDRLLPTAAIASQLSKIALKKVSTHESTVNINKVIALLRQKQTKEARAEIEKIAKVDELTKVKDERVLEIYACIYKQENKEDEAIKLIKQWLDMKKEENSFYERATVYALLYQAQLLLSKGEYDGVVEQLLDTFKASPKLCACENYIVFILSILNRLTKVTKKASEGIARCVETVYGSPLNKSTLLLSHLADLMFEQEQYKTAEKLYESLLSSGVKEAEVGYTLTKYLLGSDESGKLVKKLGDIPTEIDEEYKSLLLDETKLGATMMKAKPDQKKATRKRCKKKLPKSVETGIPPDPERWLPKWKRAKYRKRFGRKLRETQGDANSSHSTSYTTGPSTATIEVTKSKQKKK